MEMSLVNPIPWDNLQAGQAPLVNVNYEETIEARYVEYTFIFTSYQAAFHYACSCDTMPPDPRTCALCTEEIGPKDEYAPGSLRDQDGAHLVTHRECSLRSVIGGIGHLQDHVYWCNERHDPDAGMTYRQSSIAVDLWIAKYGVEEATRIQA